MKRKLMVGAFALLATVGVANAQARFGIKGGYNLAKMTNNNGQVQDDKPLSTFNAGFSVDAPIADIFSIKTGLEYQSKGWKYTQTGAVSGDFTANPGYIELPVNFAVNLPLGGATKLYVGAGPYAAIGVAGKIKWNASTGLGTASGERNIKWGSDDPTTGNNGSSGDDFKKFDAGANIIAGLDFGHFAIHTQYGLGLVNSIPGQSNNYKDNKNQHRVLGISGIFYF